jgi:hypothetical protein|tara:strand:+ start:1066 stop:1179 length:114 start_codon:yes stop_codon:yes gene_type:complete
VVAAVVVKQLTDLMVDLVVEVDMLMVMDKVVLEILHQ